MALPPGPRAPRVLQTLAFTFWPLQLLERCARRYGDPFTIGMPGFGDFVMVSAPELIKQVFTADPDELLAGKANGILEPIVGSRSVLLLDGKEHLRQRRLLLPPFHGERMAAYGTLMAEIARAEIDRMPTGVPFSIHPHMQRITLSVILRAIFGVEEGAEMHDLEALLLDFVQPPPTLMTFVPVEWLDHLDVPLSPYRAFLRRRERVDRALREVIRTRRKNRDSPTDDILSLLLQARDEDGQALTEDELRDELVTMLLAGHETTATALSWTFGLLLEHPQVLAKLDAELEPASDPAALVALDFLDAVVKESLRLRPIVPDVVRRVERPITVAGYELPVGCSLTPCIYLAHRRADSWPEPDRFRPERFVGKKVDPYQWLPFGGGLRRCLGMAFALYEMKIVLGVTLREARLRAAWRGGQRVARRGVTLSPGDGTRVVLERRSDPRRFAA